MISIGRWGDRAAGSEHALGMVTGQKIRLKGQEVMEVICIKIEVAVISLFT
jgi:hypothetical protein